MKTSKFSPGAIQHICQRAVDRGVIFYTTEDRLVYYTLAAVKSKRYRVTVSAASLMFTHTHQSVTAPSLEILRQYLHDTNTSFARLYNFRYSRTGCLFDKPPGRSQKTTPKEQRSNAVYVYNNHVEKKLCTRAIQERWSFVAYAASDHPFSDKLDIKKTSQALRKAIRLVNRRVKNLHGLEYQDLDKILPALDSYEREQFIDYVISRYAWIDFNKAISLFGNLNSLIVALDSTTGAEYEIKEEYTQLSDRPYFELINLTENRGNLQDIYSMSKEEKEDLIFWALRSTSASPYQLEKFFHTKILRWELSCSY